MTATLSLWATFGLTFTAALLGLLGDMADRNRWVALPGAALLLAGGSVGLYSAWVLPAQGAGVFLAAGGGFSVVGGLVVVLAAAAVLSGDRGSAIAEGQRVALIALAAMGAGLAAQSTSLVVLALGLETSAVCSYALVASARTRRSAESAMKYFVQGAVASGLLVLGIAVLVGGHVSDGSYVGLSQAATQGGTALLLGLLLVIVAVAFKAGAVPFHSWVADAYQSAPPASAGMLAGPLKLGAVSVLAVLVSATAAAGAGRDNPLGLLGSDLFPILCVISILSVLVGSLTALSQRSFTRMLGYAGIAQVGYALIGIASGSAPVALLFTATYAVATVGAFIAAEAASGLRPGWDGSVKGMRGLGRSHPAFGVALALLLASLAGVPPLLGFWGKLQAFQAAFALALGLTGQGLQAMAWWYWAIAVVGIVGSVVSLGYYGAVLREVFSENEDDEAAGESGIAGVVVGAIAVGVLVLGASPLFAPLSVLIRGFLL